MRKKLGEMRFLGGRGRLLTRRCRKAVPAMFAQTIRMAHNQQNNLMAFFVKSIDDGISKTVL